jgi:nucleoside-diphosphate-sugar epimerase
MRAVVLGANGFVGSSLCARLGELKHEVVAVARSQVSGASSVVVESGLASAARIAEVAEGADVIYCCAGDHDPRSSPRALAWLHIAGVENVLAAARHAGVPRVVLLSCADATLTGGDRLHWKEDSLLGQPLGAVARTKLLGEEVALHASDARLTVTSIRPAFLWGAGERRNLPALCREGLAGGIRLLGSGSALLSCAHIDLVVDALVAAATAPEAGGKAIHVADPETLTARELFERLSSALGLPAPRRSVYAIEYALAQLRSRFALEGLWPEEVARRARHGLLDCLRAATLLDLTPRTSVDEGMRALSAWAAEVGGPTAIARRARAPLSDADAARCQAIADEESQRRAS